MILFLKLCFKNIFRFLTEPGYRNFFLLALKYSGKKRNRHFYIKFKGHKIKVIDALSFVWQFRDIFTEEFYFFKSKNNNPVILDIGSNIGMSIIYFKLKYPGSNVYGFEPDPNAFDALSYNIRSFGFSADSVHIKNAAAWIDNQGTSLTSTGADSSFVSTDPPEITNTEKVDTVRLKEIIDAHDPIAFLKMDIEGAEIPVLEDCSGSLDKIHHIFVEYHAFPDKQQDLDKLLAILKNAGFRIQVHSPFQYSRPFVRRSLHPYPEMDVQLNIFAFRNTETYG